MIRISSVQPAEGHQVILSFTDDSTGQIDLEPLLRGPIFDAIRSSPDFFAQVQVDPQLGTIHWPNGADLDPDVLYELAHGAALDEVFVEAAVAD